jgi:xylulose-5-phosphate/fructose-6-phosphate phosphoketolase
LSSVLSPKLFWNIDAYGQTANDLSVGYIDYLHANPLLRGPARMPADEAVIVGTLGTTPNLHFLYVHFKRLIKACDLNHIVGPGRGRPEAVSNAASVRSNRFPWFAGWKPRHNATGA